MSCGFFLEAFLRTMGTTHKCLQLGTPLRTTPTPSRSRQRPGPERAGWICSGHLRPAHVSVSAWQLEAGCKAQL